MTHIDVRDLGYVEFPLLLAVEPLEELVPAIKHQQGLLPATGALQLQLPLRRLLAEARVPEVGSGAARRLSVTGGLRRENHWL